MLQITPIQIPLPHGMGRVNCHLLEEKRTFVLVDTGSSNARRFLLDALSAEGCDPGGLKLVLLTHGDFDHSGNAAHLGRAYGIPLAMHPGDIGMVQRGDMFFNRKQPNWLVRKLIPLATGFGRQERFTPEILVEDGFDLSRYGIQAKVLAIPGHSSGSIGILTRDGDLLCGDLFENQSKPRLNRIMDDSQAAQASLARLRNLEIRKLYPGHGYSFELKDLDS
jgi:hydroxyacylglutathione hydrolase